MASTYLVTGGTGFLGAALVRRLLQAGHRVRILDNQSRGSVARLADLAGDFKMFTGDIRDAAAVDRAVKGVDCVCHLAYINGTEFFYQMPEMVLEVGVKGMVNVLDACLEHRVRQLVLASSSEVYHLPPLVPTPETVPLVIPDPWNPRYSYAGGKIISELLALNYGRKYLERTLIFRPHNVYGPEMGWEHVIPQFALRMKELGRDPQDPMPFPIQGTGQETRAFVFIEDFMDGLMLMLEKGENLGAYHIGTTEEVPISRLAQMVGRYFHRDIAIIPGQLAAGGTPRRCPDISKLAALGYQPRYDLAAGLQPTLKWYDENASKRPLRQD